MRAKKVYPSSFIFGFFHILILFYIADFIIQNYQLIKRKNKNKWFIHLIYSIK